jgi:hypothetical protein
MGFAALVLCTSRAYGAEPTTMVNLTVVHASNEEEEGVDPALAPMKEKFGQSGINYRSYKVVSTQRVTISRAHPAELKLPNSIVADVKLEEMKGHRAVLRVSVPPVETVYELGKEGSVFVRAGHYHHGVLILVLSPAPQS